MKPALTLLLLVLTLAALICGGRALVNNDSTATELQRLRATNDAFTAEVRANFGDLYRNQVMLVSVITNLQTQVNQMTNKAVSAEPTIKTRKTK